VSTSGIAVGGNWSTGLGTSPEAVVWQLPWAEVVFRQVSKAEVEFQ